MAPRTFRYRLVTIAAYCISTRTRLMVVSNQSGGKENGVWRDLGPHTVFSFQQQPSITCVCELQSLQRLVPKERRASQSVLSPRPTNWRSQLLRRSVS